MRPNLASFYPLGWAPHTLDAFPSYTVELGGIQTLALKVILVQEGSLQEIQVESQLKPHSLPHIPPFLLEALSFIISGITLTAQAVHT